MSIKTIGLSVSAVLAVIYVLVMFGSLVLVGLGTTAFLQAFFLGIGWSAIVGIEIWFLGSRKSQAFLSRWCMYQSTRQCIALLQVSRKP